MIFLDEYLAQKQVAITLTSRPSRSRTHVKLAMREGLLVGNIATRTKNKKLFYH